MDRAKSCRYQRHQLPVFRCSTAAARAPCASHGSLGSGRAGIGTQCLAPGRSSTAEGEYRGGGGCVRATLQVRGVCRGYRSERQPKWAREGCKALSVGNRSEPAGREWLLTTQSGQPSAALRIRLAPTCDPKAPSKDLAGFGGNGPMNIAFSRSRPMTRASSTMTQYMKIKVRSRI